MSEHAFALLEVEKVHILGEEQRVVKMFNPYKRNTYKGRLKNIKWNEHAKKKTEN